MSKTTPRSTHYAPTYNYFDGIHNWRECLAMGHSLEVSKRRTLMWIWPTESELLKFGQLLETLNINHILSIGCGNGLFERIIQDCLGVAVNGIEVDRSWWESKYAIKSFININYFNENENLKNYLQKCCNLENWNFALMFCYFNNRTAFLNYIKMYKGNILLIVGPKTGVNVYTEPLPLEPHFPGRSRWELKATLNIGNLDVIAFYTKDVR
ncbi:PREDICTED: uncharacterized protein LOC108974028 isoform X1 [Bactrocera latifrons]|uniref:uncharacterized protein LOC108974028 isoform X1 n=1 Tax=Bactrocera latifrons TaxID=174628 RepID=UPI0008DCFBA6|nr:PREDICTED: uncharacterized protein LOC108974028 isoform X1 [Bactrocera latifrons]